MKKIINGKLYDTATANCVGTWCNTGNDSDFTYCQESLYRKRTGEYFLYGYGGPYSKYAYVHGDDRGYNEVIMPLKYEAAQKWAEEKLDGDQYIAIFGEIDEDDTHRTMTISISVSAIDRAKRNASRANLSLSAYIEQLISAQKDG